MNLIVFYILKLIVIKLYQYFGHCIRESELPMKKEPIAVVGLACRFPGDCNTPEAFWDLLVNGIDAITELDGSRWSTDYYCHPDRSAPGKTYARYAGQLKNVFHFDPEFFGISPREAVQMDPQQRLLLEMTWEAMEYGNQIPAQLSGSDCSVYIGISSLDYANSRFDDPGLADSYFMTGNTLSIAANRISHIFNLHGPSMALDTACSSSLVALHQACNSIWSGESQMSIAGAVHLLLSPFPYIGFSKASMLSEDGRCKVFDAKANGYVRSEGGAVFLLKPLSMAESQGDPIHALILGTGVNTDGGKPTIVVPEARAQQSLLECVYTNADIDPARIHYIEAHGTGTPVGDPIEAVSISGGIATKGERLNPLLIGSVKSNIGHLETASGAAGLMKVILALKNRAIPPSIHYEIPNPNIDFESLKLKVVSSYTPMDGVTANLLMGVNSFGFGGSNAHVIVSEYRNTRNDEVAPVYSACPPLVLSAASLESLKTRARQFSNLINRHAGEGDCHNIFYNAGRFRQPLRYGLVAWGESCQVIAAELEKYSEGKPCNQLITAEKKEGVVRTAYVFSGNGSQWHGMGNDLMREEVFRDTVHKIDEFFIPLANWSLAEILTGTTSQYDMRLTEIAQPALFAIQAGILALLGSRGIWPDAVIGHSIGEISAAYAAGIFNLEQAVKLVYFRSMAQSVTRGMGKMAAAQISPKRALELVNKTDNGLAVAAINSPRSVSFTGPEAAVREVCSLLGDDGIPCRVLDLDYAFHSEVMETVKDQFLDQLGEVVCMNGSIEFISTVTGEVTSGEKLDRYYWWNNLRQPVQFSGAVGYLLDQGVNLFVEIGPHPILKTYVHECMGARQAKATVVGTLKRMTDNERNLIESAGHEIALISGNRGMDSYFKPGGTYFRLPPYPWNDTEFRLPPSNEASNFVLDHPLLGYKLNSVEGIWNNQIDVIKYPLLADHVIDGMVIYPAAAYLETALAASAKVFNRVQDEIHNLEIRRPLIFEENQIKDLQIAITLDSLDFEIRSRNRLSNQSWSIHAVGKLAGSTNRIYHAALVDIDKLKSESLQVIHTQEIYEMALAFGLEYGPRFQGLETIWVQNDNQFLSSFDSSFIDNAAASGYILHPALLDSAFHTLIPAMNKHVISVEKNLTAYLPVGFEDIRINTDSEPVAYCLCEIHSYFGNSLEARLILLDGNGLTIARIENCLFKQLPRMKDKIRPEFYHFTQIPRNHIDACLPVPLPGINEIQDYLKANPVEEAILANEQVQIEQIQPLYEALALATVEKTLREFGAHMGEFTVDSLLKGSGIAEVHRHFVYYLLRMLEDDGKAVCQEDLWKLTLSQGNDDPLPIWRSIIADYPRYQPDMVITSEYGFDLVNKLLHDPDEYSGGAPLQVDCKFISSSLVISLLQSTLSCIVQKWPGKKRRLRIVEITDDVSSASRRLVDLLPGDYCDFQIITHDASVTMKAEHTFREYPNVRVNTINQTDNAFRHDFQEGEFDILISSGWLNRCDDIMKVLDDFNFLLASGGLLLLNERRPDRLIDINMGIAPFWWSRSMQVEQPVSRLMNADDWMVAVEKAGYQTPVLLNDNLYPDAREFIIAAKRHVRNRIDEDITLDKRHNWLLICNNQGNSRRIAEAMREELMSRGLQTKIACSNNNMKRPHRNENGVRLKYQSDYRELLESLNAGNLPLSQIVYLSGLDLQNNTTISNLIREQSACCMDIVNITKSAEVLSKDANPRIWLITSNLTLQSPNPDRNERLNLPNQAPLQGLGRVIRNEYPDLDCRHVDLNVGRNAQKNARALITEILQSDEETEIIILDDARKVMRLDNYHTGVYAGHVSDENKGKRYRLAIENYGNLDSLYWKEIRPGELAADEIEITVIVAGLNFRDIMYASGLLPDEILSDGFAGANMGMECAGIVTDVGINVEGFNPGDKVIAFAPACFSSHVVTKTTAVIHKPDTWTWEESVTILTAFFTIYYSLNHLAHLCKGEKILIHGAAGGVGLAAIQYAHYCGAEIFATAGTPEKRKFLEYLGVDHIMDSRTLDFADEIMSLTDGVGVDVVLNSLAGEVVERNISLLRPFGRFIELGKRDFLENRKIGLRRFRNNISYFAVDADQLIQNQPLLAGKLFTDMMELFNRGEFRPLSHTVFPACDISSAFRYMQQSAHIGKVVVKMQPGPVRIRNIVESDDTFRLKDKATYMITGGTSGFGFATAEWLASKGARHIILLGRREKLDDVQNQVINNLNKEGVEIQHRQCDVSDPVALKKILREINTGHTPLKGIIHAAMILEDSIIRNLDEASFINVFRPKIQGAWCLHQLTNELPLDFFILYSSATTCLGNPGQANYVAANAYLESLARFRRSQGLPALAIAWDAILDAGYLARNDSLRETFTKRLGINGIRKEQAFRALEMALENNIEDPIIMNANWTAVRRLLPIIKTPMYINIKHRIDDTGALNETVDVQELIKGLSREEIHVLISGMLGDEVARILQLPRDKVEHNRSIQDLGVDSLMAMELVAAIEKRFDVEIPIMALSDNVTVDSLSVRLTKALMSEHGDQDNSKGNSMLIRSLATTHAENVTESELEEFVENYERQSENIKRIIH
ncbi:MAG: hypothetical protein A3J35_07710 [Gammaproteobacteria bacterium RIFCSPLOWO2_02_FULL_52_10]|nr:MAG: hypothetical protein A3J35_07710 [Gammaproteobacteria bacterium RIFCSPLOWO2_02_FULL_52_10]